MARRQGPREWSPRWGQSKLFILKTELAQPGDWMPEGQECFVIEITPEYARALLGRLESFKGVAASHKDLWEMYFWDASGDYYGVDWDQTADEVDEDGRAVVAPDYDEPGRTEVDQVVIREDEVCWTAVPKHGDVYTITDKIKWPEIQEIAAEKKGKK